MSAPATDWRDEADDETHPTFDPRKPWHPHWKVRMWAEHVSFQLHVARMREEEGEPMPSYAMFRGSKLERELDAWMREQGIDPFETYPAFLPFAQQELAL